MKIRSSTFVLATFAALSLSICVVPSAAAQQSGHRDEWQRVSDVLEAAGAVPEARVADIGAGNGYFIPHLRAAVGDRGRVYAVDISRDDIVRLRDAADRQGMRNLEVILGDTDDPRLPFGALDGVIIVNAYHEMTEYPAMLEAIREALRPGGRLVIVDNPARPEEATRAEQTERHRIDIALVEADLQDAGFEIVRSEPDFIRDTDGHGHQMWLLAGRRPSRERPTQRLRGAPDGAAGLFACNFRAPGEALAERPSPPDSAEATLAGARVKICYSRPSARGRTIMGDLVPFGQPWRTGANEATVLRVDRPVTVSEIPLEPGWYSLYTIPGPDTWTVVVNGVAQRDGATIDEWVRSRDVGRIEVPVERTATPVETMTMRFDDPEAGSVDLVLEWERSRVRIPIRVDGSTP